jgi:hypothetical protein
VPSLPSPLLLSRLWVILLLVAVIAYASCAVGAAPCSIGRPLGLGASLLAAAVAFFAPDRPRVQVEEAEAEAEARR